MLFTCPTLSRLRSNSPQICSPPPGRRASDGAVTQYGSWSAAATARLSTVSKFPYIRRKYEPVTDTRDSSSCCTPADSSQLNGRVL